MELIRDGQTSLYALEEETSLELLRSASLGRVALNGADCPSIFPVQYAVDGRAIVFRSSPELQAEIDLHAVATFQADGYDNARDAAWSILAQGAVEQMRPLGQLQVPAGFIADADPAWRYDALANWMRIVPQRLTGVLSTGNVLDIT